MEKETGFPSPAQGYEEKTFDLNRIVIRNPPATYIMEAESRDMERRGIFPGSLLVVDRSVKPRPGGVVVASNDGEFRFMEVARDKNRIALLEGSGTAIPQGEETVIFGTITAVITFL
jgi:DNA polymerase V